MARPWLVPVLLLLVPGVAAHGTDPTVWVPDMVLGDEVPFVVSGLTDEAEATLEVGAASEAVDVTGLTQASGVLTGATAGLHPWTLTVTKGATTHTLTGHVYVQQPFAPLDSSLADLEALLASVETDVAALAVDVTDLDADLLLVSTDVDALQGSGSGGSGGAPVDLSPLTTQLASLELRLQQVEDKVKEVKDQTDGLGDLGADVDALATAVDDVQASFEKQGGPATSASLSDPVGRAGTLTTLLLVLGLGGFVGFSQWQAQRRRREVMVLLLSLAAKLQVSPDSEEFRSAVEALES